MTTKKKFKRFGDGGSTDEEMGPPTPEEQMGPPTPEGKVVAAPRPPKDKPKAKKPKLYMPYHVQEGKVLPAPPPKKPKPLPPTMRVAKGGMIKARDGVAVRGKTKGRMR